MNIKELITVGKDYKYLAANGVLSPKDQFVLIDVSGGAITLTLPPLLECVGMIYCLQIIAGAANCVLAVPGNEADNYAAIEALDMDAVGDHLVLLATPRKWAILSNGIA